MTYLFKEWDLYKHILAKQQVALFLDYDGTLAPIAPTPEEALIPRAVKKLLEKLSSIPAVHVTIISGRGLKDVCRLVNVKGINYAGNHGFEIRGQHWELDIATSADYKRLLEHLKKEILQRLFKFPGAFIEDKGVTLSVHYRLVDRQQGVVFEELLGRLTEKHLNKKEIYILKGKKVFEIRPPVDWNKGKAVMKILEKNEGFPIYIGDDTTDEDAFKVIRNIGIAVNVGCKEKSNAPYYLKSTQDVVKFLKYLYEVKRK